MRRLFCMMWRSEPHEVPDASILFRNGDGQMQAKTSGGRKKRMMPLLILSLVIFLLGVVALFSLNGKAVRFDTAYDRGDSLDSYFFKAGENGYTAPQRFWMAIVRYRLWIIVAAIVLLAVYVALNRTVLYSQKIAPYVFILPFVITFLVFFLYPFINTIMMSFQNITGSGTEWIGFKNYENMFSNKTFFIAMKNSLRYMVLTCLLLIPFPLLFAYMLNSKTMKAAGLFKTILFMPVLCSVVVAGIIFRMMFSELPGALMNQVAVALGGAPVIWLKGEWTAMFAMVLLCCWRWNGMNILYYMAGLKSIPADLYEAAEIDGANAVQRFRHVAWPLLKPTTIYVLTISIYAGLAMFTESYMIFGGNNSPKNYGLTIVGYLYRYGFEKVDKFGFASAVGLVLLAGAMIITVAQLFVTGTIGRKEE